MNKKVKRTVQLRVTFRDTPSTPTELTEKVRHALHSGGVGDFTISPFSVVEETRYLLKGEGEEE